MAGGADVPRRGKRGVGLVGGGVGDVDVSRRDSLEKRQGLMEYGKWREQDRVIASGVVEGAARYVVGERLDNSGMRWIEERAEAVLLLRCIEVNGDWDLFWDWADQQRSPCPSPQQRTYSTSGGCLSLFTAQPNGLHPFDFPSCPPIE